MKLPLLIGRYFGSKWRSTKHYPPPSHGTIIEPFAGGAGYSLNYAERKVILVESNLQIVNIWRWLLSADPSEIRRLPIHEPGEETPAEVTGPARDWIGFWNAFGLVRPNKRMSPSAGKHNVRASFWSKNIRDRSAETVQQIRHWEIYHARWSLGMSNCEATWFVDPPYQSLDLYRQGALDYSDLSLWCRTRQGQVIACENEGAAWLPFEPLGSFHASPREGKGRRSSEVIWKKG